MEISESIEIEIQDDLTGCNDIKLSIKGPEEMLIDNPFIAQKLVNKYLSNFKPLKGKKIIIKRMAINGMLYIFKPEIILK